ncbi:ABC transporter ATP-binding protein [Lederbergia ruris]|uniref:ABC transporter ATP-binding protein n=1 Tax=Lederbergia ruris TaxID=217495 RepID=UPI00399F3BAE
MMKTTPFRNVYQLYRYLWRESPFVTLLIVITTITTGFIPGVELWMIGELVDQVHHWFERQNQETFSPVYLSLSLLIAFMFIRYIFREASELLMEYLSERVLGQLQHQIITKGYEMDLSFYDEEESYNQLQRAKFGLENRLSDLYRNTLSIFEHLVTAGTLLITLILGHWILGPLVLLASVPSLWLKVRRSKDHFEFDYKVLTPIRRQLDYYGQVFTDKGFAKEIRLFQLQQHFIKRWKLYKTQHQKNMLRNEILEIKSSAINEIVLNLLLAIISGIIILLILGKKLSLGAFVVMFQAAIRFQQELETSMGIFRDVYENGMFAQNLFHFLEQPIHKPLNGSHPFPQPIQYGIRFEDVWFRYPNNNKWVLQGVSFEVHPGETISFVGENGSGKTTVMKLLLGLYTPQQGCIYIDNIPLLSFDQNTLREHFSAIFQDYTHFQLPLNENISIGNMKFSDNQERIKEVAVRSGVAEFVDDLEKGYETMLGKAFGGTELSGGQWQKIALARSLMRDVDILILDEPTASLDPRAELLVFEKFAELAKHQTTFLVSHRIGTARLSDRIFVLKDGKLLENGTHDQLIDYKGEYAKLFSIQAAWYKEGGR